MRHALKFVPVLTLTALALSLPAQDTAVATKTDGLVIKTSDAEVANGMLRASGEEAPDLKDGQHYVLTLGAGGEWDVKVADGKAPYMQVAAKPKQLMEMFSAEVDQARQMTGMMAGMMAAQAGMDADALQQLMDDVIDFPTQLESFSLVVEEEKGNYKAKGDLTAIKTSAFAKVVGLMKATGKGAPSLEGKAALVAEFDLAPAAMAAMFKPFMAVMPGLDTKEAKTNAQKSMDEMMEAVDGTMALTWAEAGMQMLMGATDGKKYAALMEKPEFMNFQKSMMASAEGKMTPKALTHREVSLYKSEVEIDESTPNPLAKDGKITSFGGVVGDFVMMVMNGGEGAAKQIIDGVLDQKVKRKMLSPGNFATVRVNMADFAAMVSDGQADTEDMPKSIDVQLGSNGTSITFDVKVTK